MSHKVVLQQLFPPVEIGGDLEAARLAHGGALDRAESVVEAILDEVFPDTAVQLLERWEDLYEIVPPAEATLQQRQAAVAERHCRRGDIKKPYFVAIAAAMGYTIRIEDYVPLMAGWICAGDEVLDEQWIEFTAAVSGAGDSLGQLDTSVLPFCWKVVVIGAGDGPATDLEAIIQDLKPAHRLVNFEYINP